jgi:hypothetical protein
VGGNPEQVRQAPKQSLQRKLLDGLRYLVKEELRLNQPEASDGWLTQDALWLVSKTVCDKLRAHLLSHGIEGIPANNPAVFNVLQDHAVILANVEGRAIWRATVVSDTGWTQTFSFLKVAPALIWDAGERPAAFAGAIRAEDATTAAASGIGQSTEAANASAREHEPGTGTRASSDVDVQNSSADPLEAALALLSGSQTERHERAQTLPRVFAEDAVDSLADTAESHATRPAPETGGSLGDQFMNWLRKGVQSRSVKINEARALVQTVSGTAYLISPGIFQRYVQEHPGVARLAQREGAADWQWIQKGFERLRVHRKQHGGLNIWTCDVMGPRKTRRVHGYLLADGHLVFTEIPPDNPYLKLLAGGSPDRADAA